MKVVINRRYGGFELSDIAMEELAKRKGWLTNRDMYNYMSLITNNDEELYCCDIPRDDLDLVAIVESLGEKANGRYSYLKVVEIPDDVNWYIDEYDGMESITERHRTWE